MFKLRRPSVCSDLDILSDSDSVSDATDEIQKGVSINSISESRSLGSSDVDAENQKKKRSNISCDCDGRLNESERIEPAEEKRGGQEFSNSSSTIPNNSNFASSTTSMTSPASIMCDRKRKERHESCSQGQEKKVIRSLSHDDPKGETEADKNDFRRTQSHDDFQPKTNSNSSSVNVDGDRETGERKLMERQQSNNGRPTTLNGESKQQPQQQQQVKSSSRNSELENDVDRSSYGIGATPYRPQLGLSVRHIPINFEAEAQRQWERSAQFGSGSNGNRKSGSSRRHRSRSGKSSVSSTPTKIRSHNNEETEEECRENSEEITGENIPNEDELSSSPTSESSTSSIDSLEETSDKLSCEEELETDLVADSNNTEQKETRDQRLGNSSSSSLEPLPHLDFSTLHHQVETNEPISFLQALSGIEADQVMLSPRNSSLIKECAVDPSVAPSPPLYQTVLDPPISRQHGGNQNMKINQLSKQVSNLKRHLKALEDEHEQLFGYKPSHADKLNHKEMRKCLLQFTKAKRELKQMREDPANVRTGSSLLQVMNSSTVQISYPRGSHEYLRSLDDTVKKINDTLGEKRKQTCRPDDPTQMSATELNEEKSAMQKQLLMLEKRHGRPMSKDEKDIVRNLYDRYRSLKKTGSRLGNIKENSIDLVPILEYETLELPANETNETEGNSTSIVELRRDSLTSSKSNSSKELKRRVSSVELDEEEEDDSVINIGNEGFTEMTLAELEGRQTSAREEKRRLRSLLRKYDEKHSSPEMESIYQKYKKNRAIVRLLDVLITKRKYPLVLETKIED